MRWKLCGILLVLGALAADCRRPGVPVEVGEPLPAATESPELPTQIPDTSFPSPTPTAVPYDFPDWVKDPQNELLLFPISEADPQLYRRYDHLALIDPETDERFDLDYYDDGGYFWTPDGSKVGILSKDKTLITLIDTATGLIETLIPPEGSVAHAEDYYGSYPPRELILYGNLAALEFSLIPAWMQVSYDGRYLIIENYEGKGVDYVDLISGEAFENVDTREEVFVAEVSWSPVGPYLGIVYSEVTNYYFYHAEEEPRFIFDVVDAENRQVIASYEGITEPIWSPDGRKILFQPWMTYSGEANGEGSISGSPLCIFDLDTGVQRCFPEIAAMKLSRGGNLRAIFNLNWLPNQGEVIFIYSAYHQELESYHGGICVLDLADGTIRCMFEELDTPEKQVVCFRVSPTGEFVSFGISPYHFSSHEGGTVEIGVGDLTTGEHFIAGLNNGYCAMGVWRPVGAQGEAD